MLNALKRNIWKGLLYSVLILCPVGISELFAVTPDFAQEKVQVQQVRDGFSFGIYYGYPYYSYGYYPYSYYRPYYYRPYRYQYYYPGNYWGWYW